MHKRNVRYRRIFKRKGKHACILPPRDIINIMLIFFDHFYAFLNIIVNIVYITYVLFNSVFIGEIGKLQIQKKGLSFPMISLFITLQFFSDY